MEFGCTIFFTDYSMTPADLAVAMEERGLDSVWVAGSTRYSGAAQGLRRRAAASCRSAITT